jgi:beta-RFAP synthase
MKRRVSVKTNCRLHFGLTSLGHDTDRLQFGGAGVMVGAPGVHLEITTSDRFHAEGPLAERVAQFAKSIVDHLQLPAMPELNIRVIAAPREHTGLGVGTQLGLAVAAGVAEAMGFPWRDPVRLSQLTRRGRRSAIGTYGFLLGGFLVDAGHRADEPLGQLFGRAEFPENWRFVLLTPTNQAGCAGLEEDRVIAKLPAVAHGITLQLESLLATQLIPAVQNADFATFSAALYDYGCLAGKCFAPVQGGIFSSPAAARVIAGLREQGIAGVGQSSWGPTVFALLPSEAAAKQLCTTIRNHHEFNDCELVIAPPANQGATIEVTE